MKLSPSSIHPAILNSASLFACCIALATTLGSCGKSESGDEGKTAQQANQPKEQTPPKVAEKPVKKPARPLFNTYDLSALRESLMLLEAPDGTSHPAVILNASPQRSCTIVSTHHASSIQATAATRSESGLGKANSIGPAYQGLAVYVVSAPMILPSRRPPSTSRPLEYHVLKLSPGPAMSSEQRLQLEQRLQAEQQMLEQLRAQRMQQRTQPGRPFHPQQYNPQQYNPQQPVDPTMSEPAILTRIGQLIQQLASGRDAFVVEDLFNGLTLEEVESSGVDLSSTVLATADKRPVALRQGDKWIHLDEWQQTLPSTPLSATLSVSGYNTSINVSCGMEWVLPPQSASYKLIVATTHSLESIGSGSAEERLAQLPGAAFPINSSSATTAQNCEWAGTPTTLYVRVIDTSKPGTAPIIDERIAVSFANGLIAKWERPPSPLIKLPEPEANEPENLISATNDVPLPGKLLDLIPCKGGDGLLVRVDQAPHWVPLDLQTGKIEPAAWRAGPGTLLADWGGRICAVDRKQGVLQLWNGAQREAIRLLDVTGEILAIAAPISSTQQPIMVLTTREIALIGSDFKRISAGVDLAFNDNENDPRASAVARLNPNTIWIRASADGALYTISGSPAKRWGNTPITYCLQMNGQESNFFGQANEAGFMPTRLRAVVPCMQNTLPDQAGTGLKLQFQNLTGQFPSSMPKLVFTESTTRKNIATLSNPPILPAPARVDTNDGLAPDRQLYYDSKLGLLVVPDGSTIHLHRIKLPQQPMLPPKFAFTGETLRFKAEPGTGHKVSSSPEGQTRVEGGEILWTVPETNRPGEATEIKIDWTGELGSAMSKSFRLPIHPGAGASGQQPTGDSATTPLKLRAVITTKVESHSQRIYAGGGQVMAIYDTGEGTIKVLSLVDGGLLWSTKIRKQAMSADLDRLYILDQGGWLYAYDLATGKELAKRQVSTTGAQNRSLRGFATGLSSREPLIGYIEDNNKKYLCSINRDTLEVRPLDFDPNALIILSSEFRPNPAGSMFVNFGGILTRDQQSLTFNRPNFPFNNTAPDASGRYLVTERTLYDLKSESKENLANKILGPDSNQSYMNFDISGRYLIVVQNTSGSMEKTFSVRAIGGDFPEVARFTRSGSGSWNPVVIGSTGTVLMQIKDYNGPIGIYEIALPKSATP